MKNFPNTHENHAELSTTVYYRKFIQNYKKFTISKGYKFTSKRKY
jgi:hypothetical protein